MTSGREKLEEAYKCYVSFGKKSQNTTTQNQEENEATFLRGFAEGRAEGRAEAAAEAEENRLADMDSSFLRGWDEGFEEGQARLYRENVVTPRVMPSGSGGQAQPNNTNNNNDLFGDTSRFRELRPIYRTLGRPPPGDTTSIQGIGANREASQTPASQGRDGGSVR